MRNGLLYSFCPVLSYCVCSEPPDVKISEKQINVVAGQRLVVNCHLAGASPINVSFYLNDVFLESASHGRYITLAATPQHQGTFKCVNRNDLLNMSATATTEIVVLGTLPPKQLRWIMSSSNMCLGPLVDTVASVTVVCKKNVEVSVLSNAHWMNAKKANSTGVPTAP